MNKRVAVVFGSRSVEHEVSVITAQQVMRALETGRYDVVPIYIMCDPNDIRSVSMVRAPFSQRPTIYIYDSYPGCVGFSQKLFRLHDTLLEVARELMSQCGCESGCPSCVGPALEVGETGKKSAMKLIQLATADLAQ